MSTPPPSTPPAAKPADPAQKLYEQLHAGAFQFDAALGSLNEAVQALRPLPNDQGGDTKEALLNVLDMLDSSGRTLADHNDSPTVDEVRADVKQSDGQRIEAINDAIDAIREVRETQGVIGDMLNSAPPAKEKAGLTKADASIAEALEAMEEGVRLLGGTVPEGAAGSKGAE
jgi:hypothetical protein